MDCINLQKLKTHVKLKVAKLEKTKLEMTNRIRQRIKNEVHHLITVVKNG